MEKPMIVKSLIPAPVIFGMLALLLTSLFVGATFYHLVEGLSVIDSIYFAAMTLTTVGYGDFVPKTDIGKIFTALFAFVGIGLFLSFAALLSQRLLSRMHKFHKDLAKNRKTKK